MPKPVTRYLEKRSVRGPWTLAGEQRYDFAGAVVIPALAESADLFATLDSLAAAVPAGDRQALLTVVVINQPAGSPDHIGIDNRQTLAELPRYAERQPRLPLTWIDAASPGLELPAEQAGVGLARKLGFDHALTRLDWQTSEPILISLDADTLVSSNYQQGLLDHFQKHREGGAVIPFRHRPGNCPAQDAAITYYELFLRSHVLGLAQAGSPYAFHTVGSALACRASAYLQCGGMNQRRAGEDFYFLQQLAKTVGIVQTKGIEVSPSPRVSRRVLFGTGPSVERHMRGEADAIRYYPLRSYQVLHDWLTLTDDRQTSSVEELLGEADAVNLHLGQFLRNNRISDIWPKLQRNNPAPQAFRKAFHTWFDGLKTLRLIHHLCDTECARGSAEQVLPELLHWAGLQKTDSPAAQLELLRQVQNQGLCPLATL